MKQVWLRKLINKMPYIRDPHTGVTFTIKEWEKEKIKRKEQMRREFLEEQNERNRNKL